MPNTDFQRKRHLEEIAGMTDEELYRRNRERDERQRESWERRHPRLYSKSSLRTGERKYWTIDANGKRTDFDRNGNAVNQADKNAETIVGLVFVTYLLVGLGLGLILSERLAGMTTVQALLVIWIIALGLVGFPTYRYFDEGSWVKRKMLKDNEDLAIWAGAIAGFALLVTAGWVLGDSLQGAAAQSASMNPDGLQILVGIVALVFAILLAITVPWVGIPILIVLILGMLSS